MCFQDFHLKGCPSLTPFAFSSYGKEGVGPSIELEVEATCDEGWRNETEGGFVTEVCGASMQGKWLSWGLFPFQHQTDVTTNIN